MTSVKVTATLLQDDKDKDYYLTLWRFKSQVKQITLMCDETRDNIINLIK